MPTVISHSIFAALAGRFFRPKYITKCVWVWGALSAALPDADVLGFRYGISYSSAFGHRGFTHSIFFALVWSGLSLFILRVLSACRYPLCVWGFVFLCTISHGLFDAMTNGGKGVAFFFPLDNTRYFLPWRPIVVSYFGVESLFTSRGLAVLVSEIKILLLPAFILSTAWSYRRGKKLHLTP